MKTKLKLAGISLAVLSLVVAFVVGRSSTNQAQINVPAATTGITPSTEGDKIVIQLVPTDNIMIPLEISSAYVAYAELGTRNTRIYSSYLPLSTKLTYFGWLVDEDGLYTKLCQLKVSEERYGECDADYGTGFDQDNVARIIVTQQQKTLGVPGEQLLVGSR